MVSVNPIASGSTFSGHAQCSNLIGHCNFFQLNQRCQVLKQQWLTEQTLFSAVIAFAMKSIDTNGSGHGWTLTGSSTEKRLRIASVLQAVHRVAHVFASGGGFEKCQNQAKLTP